MNTSLPARCGRALAALLAIGLLHACGGGDDGGGNAAPIGPQAVVVGSAGGVVTGPDGVTVTVPPGALAADTTLQITAADSASVLALPAGVAAPTKAYDLLPHGTVFSVPATLSLPREAGDPDSDASILKTNAAGDAWEQLVTSTTPSGHSALITSFSTAYCMCGTPPQPPPVISVQPRSGSVDEGGYVLLGVTAIGVQPLTYQWRSSYAGILTRETTSAIVINPITRGDDGVRLSVVVTDRLGRSTTSDSALINVRAAAPVIVAHPGDRTVRVGSTATFAASSISSVAQELSWERLDPVTQQWNAAPSQTARLDLPNVQLTDDQARYRFGARNAGTTMPFVYSNAATLTVQPAETLPAITRQPVDVNTIGGRSASFVVGATGTNLGYQWWMTRSGNRSMVPASQGGESATLTISNPTRADDGRQYDVVVSNSLGDVTSNTVTLHVASMNEALATRLAGGRGHSMALFDDGSLFSWGANDTGALGHGNFSPMAAPRQVMQLSGVATFAVGSEHSLAIDQAGTLYTWGQNLSFQLGDGAQAPRHLPFTVDLGGVPARFVGAGELHSFAGTGGSSFLSWGSGLHGDGRISFLSRPASFAPDFVSLSSRGSNFSVGLRSDGTVWTWGSNGDGQLGSGDTQARVRPAPITGVDRIVSVATGGRHAVALRNDGTVFAWGAHFNGRLGGNNTVSSAVPLVVPLPGVAIAIAAGAAHSLALLSDGRVFAWGHNADGAIGNGSNLDATTPVLVDAPFMGPIQSIGAGERHSLALDAMGLVWAWGDNATMQLGDGTRLPRNRPVLVQGVPVP